MRQTLTDFGASGDTAERYEDLIRYTERLHRISDDFYFWKSIGGLRDMMKAAGEVGGARST